MIKFRLKTGRSLLIIMAVRLQNRLVVGTETAPISPVFQMELDKFMKEMIL